MACEKAKTFFWLNSRILDWRENVYIVPYICITWWTSIHGKLGMNHAAGSSYCIHSAWSWKKLYEASRIENENLRIEIPINLEIGNPLRSRTYIVLKANPSLVNILGYRHLRSLQLLGQVKVSAWVEGLTTLGSKSNTIWEVSA